jgi:tetratricopeptide (TPR) repeat protein
MLLERAFAGIYRAKSWSVDETAITLKLRPVPRRLRDRWRARWPIAVFVTLAGLTAAPMIAIDTHDASPTERAALPRPRVGALAPPSGDAGPILASAVLPIFDATEDVVVVDDADGIVIFDEPARPAPETITRATHRARARGIARLHLDAGEAARGVGDLAAAKHEFEAALTALPSYGPAAAALAEIHMMRGSYRSALGYAKRASRAAPRKLDYMLLLGDAYSRTNNRAAAEKLWRKAAVYGSPEARSRLAR